MTTVKYGHVIFLGHSVNRAEKGQEVLLRVNVLFPVRGKQDVFTFLEMQSLSRQKDWVFPMIVFSI